MTILCILTFIGGGPHLIANGFLYLMFDHVKEIIGQQEELNFLGSEINLSFLFDIKPIFFLIQAALYFLSVFGAFQMFQASESQAFICMRLHKFYCLFFRKYLSQCLPFPFFELMVSTVFIFLYYKNLTIHVLIRHLENKLQHEIKEIQKTVTPFIYRSCHCDHDGWRCLRLFFFSSVIFFKIDGSNFPGYFQYNDPTGIVFTIFLILQIAIHIGFIFSAIQLIKNKKAGVYIYALCIILFITSRLYYSESLVFIEIFSGLILLFLMMLSWKKLK